MRKSKDNFVLDKKKKTILLSISGSLLETHTLVIKCQIVYAQRLNSITAKTKSFQYLNEDSIIDLFCKTIYS